MTVYLDNSSTTRQFDEVTDKISDLCKNCYGNPSSLHSIGFDAEKIIKKAKADILSAIGGNKDDNIVFTSGGTESNNLAILGTIVSRLKRNPHIITTEIEHPSVLEVFHYLEKNGATCSFIGVDKNGSIDMEQLKNTVTEKTDLVSVMLLNNEVGSCQPLCEISKYAKKLNPNVLVHADAVQAFCKMPINVSKADIDLLSISGHKIHGPKGIGCLYIRKGVNVKPFMFGGHQQGNLRSGTENVPAIGGLCEAVRINRENFDEKLTLLRKRKERLEMLLSGIDGCHINNPCGENSSPNIVNASFDGVRSETMLHALESAGVYVSAGSACSSNHPGLSHVLSAMGFDKKRIDSALRFSLSVLTTDEDIDYAADEVKKAYKVLSL